MAHPPAARAVLLANGANATGIINTNDIDQTFANAGDAINLRLGTTNFDGLLQLYAPNERL